MKKFLTLALSAVMTLTLLAGCGDSGTPAGSGSAAPAGGNLIFTTGGETGTYYAFGGVIAQDVSANTATNVTAISSDGSKANVLLLKSGDAQMGFCQSDVMAYAYNGTSTFADTGAYTEFSTVANLYMEQVQIVTCDPDIKTVADLEGKKVSVGAAGSGVYFNAVDILSAYGIGDLDADGKFTKINATYQSFGDSADALKDGKIDAAFIVAGAPTTAIVDLSTTKPVSLVSLDDEHIDALLKSSPYYSKCTIKADVYGLDSDTTSVAVGAVILARDDVPADAIKALCADIFDNASSLVSSHAKYGELNLEYASSITSVPYHAGAVEYFAEHNITVAGK